MDRRYQVFLSSTYEDLRLHRHEVIQALLELDCMPAGMELFPAADEEQWDLITRVINESDYYLLILGGRYGSTDSSGLSFTEKEYDYALSAGKPVLAFFPENPGDIPSELCEEFDEGRAKLSAFSAKVKKRLCKGYQDPHDLGGVVSRSMIKLIKGSPAQGWVPGEFALTPERESEIAELRATVAEFERVRLSERLNDGAENTKDLAQGDEEVSVSLVVDFGPFWMMNSATIAKNWNLSWNEIFRTCGPLLMDAANEQTMALALSEEIRTRALRTDYLDDVLAPNDSPWHLRITDSDFHKIKVQLFALNLIEKSDRKRPISDKQTYWTLTRQGEATLMRLMAIKRGEGLRPDGKGTEQDQR